jgi:Icc-related predicted phosphoesterase
MKIIALSDTHNQHNHIRVPDGDILVHCGDFTNQGTLDEITSFADWFAQLPHKWKILVFGNHEVSTDIGFYDSNWKDLHSHKMKIIPPTFWTQRGITVLCNETIKIQGYNIWGHPALPFQYNLHAWGYRSPEDSSSMWSRVPADTDIILTHSPPYGILDETLNGVNIGNEDMLVNVVDRIKPRMCIFGHVHNPGTCTEWGILFNNVAMCNDKPELTYPPTIIVID